MNMDGRDVPLSDDSRRARGYTILSALVFGSAGLCAGWFTGVAVFHENSAPMWVAAAVNFLASIGGGLMFWLWFGKYRCHRRTDIVCHRLGEAKSAVITAGLAYLGAWADIAGGTRQSLEGGS